MDSDGRTSASPARSAWSVGLASVLERAAERQERGQQRRGEEDGHDAADHLFGNVLDANVLGLELVAATERENSDNEEEDEEDREPRSAFGGPGLTVSSLFGGDDSAAGDEEQNMWDAALDSVLEDSLDAEKALEQERAHADALQGQLESSAHAMEELRDVIRARDQTLETVRKDLLAEKLRRREAEQKLADLEADNTNLRVDLDEAHARLDALLRVQSPRYSMSNAVQPLLDVQPSSSPGHGQTGQRNTLIGDREETKSENSAGPSLWPHVASVRAAIELSSYEIDSLCASSTTPALMQATPSSMEEHAPQNVQHSIAASASAAASHVEREDQSRRLSTAERAHTATSPIREVGASLSSSANAPQGEHRTARCQVPMPRVENSVSSFELLQQLRSRSSQAPRRRRQRPHTGRSRRGPDTPSCTAPIENVLHQRGKASSGDHIEHAWALELAAERDFQRRLLLGKDPADRRLQSAWEEASIPFRERLAVIQQLDDLAAEERPLYAAEQLERIKRRARSTPDASKVLRVARQLEAVVSREQELAPERAPPHADHEERARAALALSRDRRRMERHVRVSIRNWQREHRRVFYYRGIPFLELLDARHVKTCRDADAERHDARLRRIPYHVARS